MNKIDSVKIKMYNTGSVGDCFLMLFQRDSVTTFSMLIDCGGYKTKKETISKCVADIKSSIVDNSIDLVVVTHEHEDHVSGFNQAREIFKDIIFKQVWMSWAENDKDPLAQKLLAEKGKKIKALKSLVKNNIGLIKRHLATDVRIVGLRRSLSMRKASFEDALEVLAFEDVKSLSSLGVRLKISDAMQYVKQKSKSKSREKMFRVPGEVIKGLKGADGVKFHILGPPYDLDLHGIKNDLQHDEMYGLVKRLGLFMNGFHFNAIESRSDTNINLVSPFSAKYHMSKNDKGKFFRNDYNLKKRRWRQIEYDWLDSTGELAIAINSYVNNTSLAMAIELPSGKVLLFPADAQSGNWISWHDGIVEKELRKNGGRSASELLEDTVFYKVGHHGSHNGTASSSGLEKMKNSKLVAFMPLVQDKVPSQWGGSKNFPAKALYEKLIECTKGVIIRTDEGLITHKKAIELRKKNFTASEIKQMQGASSSPVFHEWVIEN